MSRRHFQPSAGYADHQEILELVGIAVLTIDSSGILLQTNMATAVMFGHDDEDMLGRNVKMLMPEFHAHRHDGYLSRYLETGETRIIGEGRKVEGLRADGSVFPMHLAVGRFDRDGQTYFTGIVHDLSEQEIVLDRASRFGRIIDESLNEIYVFEITTLNFTLVNRGALLNLGYSIEEMQAKTPPDIKPEFSEQEFRRLIHPLLRGDQQRLHFQTVHERKDGSRYDADIVVHLSDAVFPPELVAIVQDITESNRLTAALNQSQKMEAMGQLTGGVAHDFNNLLTVISGNLELLEMQSTTADQRELLTEARAASNLGAELTQRLLSFARKSTLVPEPVDLNEAILALSALVRRSLGGRVSLTTTLSPELNLVTVDGALFDSALMNLAINGRDAMSEGGELTIETSRRVLFKDEALSFDLPAGEYAVVIVSDTGHGIEPDHLKNIFDPFFTTKATSGGSGLGLSMVYGFARQSGGHVTVDSESGAGTRFSLWLPQSMEGAVSLASRQVNGDDATNSRPTRILLVDDDDSVRRLTERRLRGLRHEVLTAGNGPSALALYNETPDIDLLLTDMVMPEGMSGYELAKALRQLDPELPVIIASGYSEQLASLQYLRGDRIGLLRKPYDLSQLEKALAQALGAPSLRV